MKKTLLCAVMALAFIACSEQKPANAEAANANEAVMSSEANATVESTTENNATAQIVGLQYSAILPCADCEGIKSDLVITDNTFVLDEEYLSAKEGQTKFQSKGSVDQNETHLTLNGEDRVMKFKKVDENLLFVNENLEEPSEEMKENYTFKLLK